MAEKTAIAWCDSTFNPWIGCTKVGPGCDGCYAEAQDRRYAGDDPAKIHWGPGVARRRTSAKYWREPLKWNAKAKDAGRPWRVFCASQADVFDNEIDHFWRQDLWALIRATPHLTWLLVTKRIGNVEKMLPADWSAGYPNVWLIATVCTQAELDRDAPKLIAIPARIRGLSIEPQLEAIDATRYLYRRLDRKAIGLEDDPLAAHLLQEAIDEGCADAPYHPRIDWIIVGGESRQPPHTPRPFDLQHAFELVMQCQSAGVPVFVKQLGSVPIVDGRPYSCTGKGNDMAAWPESLRVREFPA